MKNLTQSASRPASASNRNRRPRRRSSLRILAAILLTATIVTGCSVWLIVQAGRLKDSLQAASQLVPQVKAALVANDAATAGLLIEDLKAQTGTARSAGTDPLWQLAGTLPGAGPNFRAASEVAAAADDVARTGLEPLISVSRSLDWSALLIEGGGIDVASLAAAGPAVTAAAQTVSNSSDQLASIDTTALLPQVSAPLVEVRDQLTAAREDLDAAAGAANVIPAMLGHGGTRNYLLMIQNNAEARASGGIPGALAVLTVEDGRMTLQEQTSAVAIGPMQSPIPVDPAQQQIYSASMGSLMQDVNLTPDFPTAAQTALGMWEQKFGTKLDGVLSVDPVALSYLLTATGPIALPGAEAAASARGALPSELWAGNVVDTLLSDVYAHIQDPALQDEYFAAVAQEVFHGVTAGKVDPEQLVSAISLASAERRLLVWSGQQDEQGIIGKYPLGGSIAGSSVGPAEFGAYFNDGTGAKMDYYVQRTAQLVEQCGPKGDKQVMLRITSTNSAPADAAVTLPPYVTGNGVFGTPAGHVQTNVTVYGPAASNIGAASADGVPKAFSAQRHSQRPVGTVTTRLAPGQSATVEFTFVDIPQDAEPTLNATPTVKPVADVILERQSIECSKVS